MWNIKYLTLLFYSSSQFRLVPQHVKKANIIGYALFDLTSAWKINISNFGILKQIHQVTNSERIENIGIIIWCI